MADLRDYTKSNPIFVGTDGIRLPSGNSAQRVASANVAGTLRYNTDIGGMEVYNPNGWLPLAAPPSISTVSPSTFSGESGTEFTINGSNFTPDAQVYFVTANNTALLAATVSYYSPVQVRATTPRAIKVEEEPISVRVVQQSGTTTKINSIDAGGVPSWITTGGALGSIFGANTVNVYVSATDPEGTAVTYQLASGSLPAGLSLSANGLVQGVASSVLANTLYNFVIKANDTVNNNTDRSFSYTVLNRPPVINTASGNLGTIYSGNAASATISAYDPDGGQLTYSVSSGTLPANTGLGTANGVIQGTPVVVTTNTIYSFTITSTDEGSLTASNNYTYTILNRPPVWNTESTLSTINGADPYTPITVNAYDPDGGSVTYSLTSGSVPSGLSFVSANATIIGTPAEVESNTTSTFNITATDIGEMGNTRTFSLTITPITDPQFANTVLLLKTAGNTVIADASVNNLPLTVVGDSRASNFNPFNTTWSTYFTEGSTQAVRVAANASLEIGTGDYTFECWINTTNGLYTPGYSMSLFGTTDEASWGSLGCYSIAYRGGGNGFGGFSDSIAIEQDNGTQLLYWGFNQAINNGVWHHIAITRKQSTTTWELFIDGISKGTTTTNGNKYLGKSTYRSGIGTCEPTNGDPRRWAGYISNLRISNAVLYTSTFIPSTTRLTSTANTVLLACRSGGFIDSGPNQIALTPLNNPTIGSWAPFVETDTSNGSMYFDGTGDYVTIPNNTAFSYDGTFSAELWYYSTHTSCTDVIPFSGNGNWDFIIPAATTVAFRWFVPGYGDTGAHTMAPNSWNHIAVAVSGGRLSFYLNGVRMYTNASVSFSVGGSDTSKIGYGSNSIMKGYISNVRVTRGSTPYDPTQTTITVPSSPLTTISGTTFLTLQNRLPHNNHGFQDSSNNKHLVTRTGNATQGTFSPFSQTGWSNYFTSAGISIPYAASLQLQNTDWTIESYFNLSSASAEFCVMGASNGGGGVPKYFMGGNWNTSFGYAANRATFFTYTGSSRFIDVPYNWQIGRWYHMAAVYTHSNTTITLYVDGVNVGSMPYGIDNVTGSILIGRNGENGGPINGYISNFRYIVGTSLYTSNFTPSTIPLTAITNTQILTCQSNRFLDNSTSNRTVSIAAGTPSVQAFSPFAPTSAYSTANTGGSIYLDGTGDYIDITDSANFTDLGGRAAHLEFWFYPLAISTQVIISKGGGSADWGSSGFEYQVQYVSGTFYFYWNAAGTPTAISLARPINSWYHLVVATDSSNNIAFFINGVRVGTGSSAIYKPSSRTMFRVGQDVSSNWTNGHLSGLKFVAGNNAYSPTVSTITVPTTPPRNEANTVVLLNFTDAAIIDYTGKNVIETIADTKSNNSIYKFSPGSMTFDGTGDFLTLRENEFFRFGSSDFTIEAWVYPTYVAGSNYYTLAWHNNGSSVSDVIGTTQFNINTWTHIAWSKTGTSMRFFINGVLDADGVKTVPAIIYNNADPLRIGYGVDHSNGSGRDFCHCGEAGGGNNKWFAYFKNGGTGNYYGHISDFRISRSARYVANFTPPTRSFPNK